MKKALLTVLPALVVLVGAVEAVRAQSGFQVFAVTDEARAFAVMFTNGSSAQYFLRYSVDSSGSIKGRAVRYDIPAESPSPSPRNGRPVAIVASKSRLGLPVSKPTKQYAEYMTNVRCPFMISLSDGAKIKGILERTLLPDGDSSGSMTGTITYKGATGSTLSLSNPY